MTADTDKSTAVEVSKPSLPKGWRWVRLGDVCTQDRRIIEPGSTTAASRPYLSLEHVESNTGRILRDLSDTIEDEKRSTTFAFDSRHILYGKLRPYLNKVALPDFDGRCTTELIPLLPRESVSRIFLAWLLRHKETVDEAMLGKTGSRMPRANMRMLLRLLIPFPPLSEQRRIAAILKKRMAAVDAARAATEKALQAAQTLPTAYLREVFNSPEAKKWPKDKLGKHLRKVGSGITPRGGESTYLQSGIPLIRSQNVHLNHFVYEGLAFISDEQDAEMESSRVYPGDVLLNITGASIGRVCVVPQDICPANVNQHVSIIRSDGDIHPVFLSYYIASPDFQKFIMNTQAGATRQALTKTLIEGFKVPMPPLHEQEKIVANLTESITGANQIAKTLEKALITINALPAALLRQAFSGKLSRGKSVSRKGIVFRRGAIASYIINRLYKQKTFGRVQLGKGLYLAEAHVGIDLGGEYKRDAAGPYDSDFLYKLESLAARKGWFAKRKRGAEGFFYRPGPNIAGRLKAAEGILADCRAEMDRLLDLIEKMDTEQTEIVATLFAAWNDFLLQERAPSDEQIIREVREKWHISKERFGEARLRTALDWMRQESLIPRGRGRMTVADNAA